MYYSQKNIVFLVFNNPERISRKGEKKNPLEGWEWGIRATMSSCVSCSLHKSTGLRE